MPPETTPQTPTAARRRGASNNHRLLWGGAVLAATGVALLFAGQAWLEGYLKGPAFRQKTEDAIGRALHAHATLGVLQRQGTAVSSESLSLTGESGAFFKTLRLQGLWAELDLAGIWRRLWLVETLKFQRLELELDAPAAGEPTSRETAISAPPATGWLHSLLPNKTQVASIQTDRATIVRSGLELRETRATAKPQEGGWDITLESGVLQAKGLPAMELAQARLITRAEGATLRSARLLVKGGGQMNLTGDWQRPSGVELHSQFENIDAQPFLPVWWQTRLHGALAGALKFNQNPAHPKGEWAGDVRLTNGRLEALPLLTQLGTFIGNPRFRQVPLKAATAHLVHTPARTELQNLDLDADGVLRLRGNVTVENGTIKGALKLGISPSLVQWLTGPKSQIFSESSEGYVWVPFELSGTTEQPVENLSSRLMTGAAEAISEKAKELPGKLPGGVPEAARGLLDAVKSLIPGK